MRSNYRRILSRLKRAEGPQGGGYDEADWILYALEDGPAPKDESLFSGSLLSALLPWRLPDPCAPRMIPLPAPVGLLALPPPLGGLD